MAEFGVNPGLSLLGGLAGGVQSGVLLAMQANARKEQLALQQRREDLQFGQSLIKIFEGPGSAKSKKTRAELLLGSVGGDPKNPNLKALIDTLVDQSETDAAATASTLGELFKGQLPEGGVQQFIKLFQSSPALASDVLTSLVDQANKRSLQSSKDTAAAARTDTSAAARVESANIGATSRQAVAAIGAGSREAAAGTGAEARLDAARISAEGAATRQTTGIAARAQLQTERLRAQTQVVGDPSSPTGTTVARRTEAIGQPGPPRGGLRFKGGGFELETGGMMGATLEDRIRISEALLTGAREDVQTMLAAVRRDPTLVGFVGSVRRAGQTFFGIMKDVGVDALGVVNTARGLAEDAFGADSEETRGFFDDPKLSQLRIFENSLGLILARIRQPSGTGRLLADVVKKSIEDMKLTGAKSSKDVINRLVEINRLLGREQANARRRRLRENIGTKRGIPTYRLGASGELERVN